MQDLEIEEIIVAERVIMAVHEEKPVLSGVLLNKIVD